MRRQSGKQCARLKASKITAGKARRRTKGHEGQIAPVIWDAAVAGADPTDRHPSVPARAEIIHQAAVGVAVGAQISRGRIDGALDDYRCAIVQSAWASGAAG